MDLDQEAQVEQRREERMEIIMELADLKQERDKETNKLRRMSHQTLSRLNFGVLEELYITGEIIN